MGNSIEEFVVPLCLVAIALLAVANLRGVRESGFAFAIPSYMFIVVMYALVGWGLYRLFGSHNLGVAHSAEAFLAARPGSWPCRLDVYVGRRHQPSRRPSASPGFLVSPSLQASSWRYSDSAGCPSPARLSASRL